MFKGGDQVPLFSDISEKHQRDDAFSGPYGFVVGGMCLPTNLEMAEQYLLAANVLADTILRQEQEDYRLANPVLFLYRHSLELILKALLPGAYTHHKLSALGADFIAYVREHYQQDVPKWITASLDELAALDPNSMAFRYGEEKYGGSKQLSPVPGETYVDVGQLRKSINELFAALLGASERMQLLSKVVT